VSPEWLHSPCRGILVIQLCIVDASWESQCSCTYQGKWICQMEQYHVIKCCRVLPTTSFQEDHLFLDAFIHGPKGFQTVISIFHTVFPLSLGLCPPLLHRSLWWDLICGVSYPQCRQISLVEVLARSLLRLQWMSPSQPYQGFIALGTEAKQGLLKAGQDGER
jgi:hypothetical protein